MKRNKISVHVSQHSKGFLIPIPKWHWLVYSLQYVVYWNQIVLHTAWKYWLRTQPLAAGNKSNDSIIYMSVLIFKLNCQKEIINNIREKICKYQSSVSHTAGATITWKLKYLTSVVHSYWKLRIIHLLQYLCLVCLYYVRTYLTSVMQSYRQLRKMNLQA